MSDDPAARPSDDWLLPPEPASTTVDPDDEATRHAPRSRLSGVRQAVALLAAGAVLGGGIAYAASSHADRPAAAPFSAVGGTHRLPPGVPGGFAPVPGSDGTDSDDGGTDARGGVNGEQRLTGTVTRVGTSSVTVRSATGTTTYHVLASTQLVRNGAPAALSAFRPGDQVLVHAYPSGAGGALVVERLFATTANTA